MHTVREGQCGLCKHFGESHPSRETLLQIRRTHQAEDDYIDECGHPKHVSLHLRVNPSSGCDGFEPAWETREQGAFG